MRVSSIQEGERTKRGVPLGSRHNPGRWVLVVSALAIVLSGCKPVGPNYKRPGYDAPPAYKELGGDRPAGTDAWRPAQPSDAAGRGPW